MFINISVYSHFPGAGQGRGRISNSEYLAWPPAGDDPLETFEFTVAQPGSRPSLVPSPFFRSTLGESFYVG